VRTITGKVKAADDYRIDTGLSVLLQPGAG
jgi:hypothetical protein